MKLKEEFPGGYYPLAAAQTIQTGHPELYLQ